MMIPVAATIFHYVHLLVVGVTQELAYLSSVLALKKGKGPEKIIELLNEAIELHFAGLKVGLMETVFYSVWYWLQYWSLV